MIILLLKAQVTKSDELQYFLKSSQIITELNEKHKIVLVSSLDLNLLQRGDNHLIKQAEKKSMKDKICPIKIENLSLSLSNLSSCKYSVCNTQKF